jgi:hypothetical protein
VKISIETLKAAGSSAELILTALEMEQDAARGTRLPDGWRPSLEDLVFDRTLLHPDVVAREVDTFRDYWHARAGPQAVKKDWAASGVAAAVLKGRMFVFGGEAPTGTFNQAEQE